MVITRNFNFNNVNFDIRIDDKNQGKMPLVIFFHGFKSFRNWGFIPYICSELAVKGMIAINSDFEYNGVISENPVVIDEERFAKNTVTREFQNAEDLIDFLVKQKERNLLGSTAVGRDEELQNLLEKYWNGQINLIGHSRGGGIAILAANKFPEINKIALLAPIAFFDRYTERLKKRWIEDGFIQFNDSMSKQILRMDADYVKDVIAKKEEYDLIKIIAKLPKKILILHGENDLSVPLEEVGKLVDSYTLNPISDEVQPYFVLLSKANHIFNVNHPFESSNQYLDKVCENLIDFLSGD